MTWSLWRVAGIRARCTGAVLAVALAGCGGTAPAGDTPVEEEGEQSIHLTPDQVVAAGITLAAAEVRSLTDRIEATAVIEAVPDRTARVGSRVSGRVTGVHVNVGDQLREGQELALVDSPELGRAKADFLAALADEGVARQTADREERLYRERISSEREWREAEATAVRARSDREAAEARLHALGMTDSDLEALTTERHYGGTYPVRTPLAGVVVERRATLGETITPAEVLFTVMDLATVWLQVEVYDEQLTALAVGQTVRARARAWPDRVFSGRVDNIGAVLDPTTRAVRVRVVVANGDGALKPGMFADVEIERPLPGDSTVLAVPAGAVQEDRGVQVVFLARGPGEYQRRVVTTGPALRDWVVIRGGLAPGDSVVVTGAFVLKAESRKGELGEGH